LIAASADSIPFAGDLLYFIGDAINSLEEEE